MPRHLHKRFDQMMCGKPDHGFRLAFLEAFMAGAAAYSRLLDEVVATGDPVKVARRQDELIVEIEERDSRIPTSNRERESE